jgi:hypothetical protein
MTALLFVDVYICVVCLLQILPPFIVDSGVSLSWEENVENAYPNKVENEFLILDYEYSPISGKEK